MLSVFWFIASFQQNNKSTYALGMMYTHSRVGRGVRYIQHIGRNKRESKQKTVEQNRGSVVCGAWEGLILESVLEQSSKDRSMMTKAARKNKYREKAMVVEREVCN